MVLKIKDIENYYSNVIRDYLNNGFNFYTKASHGSQGEISRVLLTNDNYIISVRLENSYAKDYYIDMVSLIIEQHDDFDSNIIWNGHGTILYEKQFYKITDRKRKEVFVENLNDCLQILEKQYKRCNIKQNYDYCFDGDKQKLLSIVKNHKCYSWVTKKNIGKVVNLGNCYKILINKKDMIYNLYVYFPKKVVDK